MSALEAAGSLHTVPLALHSLYPALKRLVTPAQPYLSQQLAAVEASPAHAAAAALLASAQAAAAAGTSKKAAKKAAASATATAPSASATKFSNDDVVRPVLGDVDWASAGLVSVL